MNDSSFTNELMAAGLAWLPASLLGEAEGDIASVLEFGADPTGIKDSAPAINQALATGNPTWMPKGTYRVNSAIHVGPYGKLFGDGRGLTNLQVDQSFSPTDLGVIVLTGAEFQSPILYDFSINFQQPSDQGSRANFKTLAEGGTSTHGGTGVKYPAGIYNSQAGGNRANIRRIQMTAAWNGIESHLNWAPFIADMEIGSFNVAYYDGVGLDFSHIYAFHHWNFGIPSNQPIFNVFTDGQNFAARIGDNGISGGEFIDFVTLYGRVYVTGQSIAIFSALAFDSGGTLEIINNVGGFVVVSSGYADGGGDEGNGISTITVSNSVNVSISNFIAGAHSNVPVVSIGPTGILHMTGCQISTNANSPANPAINQTGGQLFLDGCMISVNDAALGAWGTPIITQSGGSIQMSGCHFGHSNSGSMPGLTLTDNALNYVAGNNFAGWPFTSPGSLGYYSYNTDGVIQGPIVTNGPLTINAHNLNVEAFTTTLGLEVDGSTSTNRNLFWSTAKSARWNLFTNGTPESGSNAGSDLYLNNYADDGVTVLGTPLSIARATGDITVNAPIHLWNTINPGGVPAVFGCPVNLSPLPASTSYANDAAAAAGGVAVGQLYRNGSVVQVRVS